MSVMMAETNMKWKVRDIDAKKYHSEKNTEKLKTRT